MNEVNFIGAKRPKPTWPKGAGAAFRAITEHTSYIELTEIWRQQISWQKEATIQFATQQTAEAIAKYAIHDHVHEFDTQAQAKQALISLWNDVRISQSDKTQIILAYTRKDVLELNEIARSIRQSLGELGQDYSILTERGERQFAEGDRIYFLKNDRELGVKNGTLGTISKINDKSLTVHLDKDNNTTKKVKFAIDQYNDIDYGYAATIHKGQGITVDRTYVLASTYLDRHATYVAMTRHREGAELFWSKEIFPTYSDLVATLSRERSKDLSLDYDVNDFAMHRGINLESHQVEIENNQDANNALNWEEVFTDIKNNHPEIVSELTHRSSEMVNKGEHSLSADALPDNQIENNLQEKGDDGLEF